MVKLQNEWSWHWELEQEQSTFIGKLITSEKKKILDSLLHKLIVDEGPLSVLEVGSGEGNLTEVLEKHTPSLSYLGIDYSPSSVRICEEKKLLVVRKDLFEEKNKYDIIMSDGLIEHHIVFPEIIKKMCNLSNKFVLIIQPDHSTSIIRLLLLLESFFKKRGNIYEYNFRMCDYIQEFYQNDFRLIKIKSVFFGGYKFLLFKKLIR